MPPPALLPAARAAPLLRALCAPLLRPLSTATSQAAAEPSTSSSPDEAITLTPAAADRIRALLAHPPPSAPASPTALRLTVESGGCSGFSYGFALDGGPPQPGDRRFGGEGAALVVDGVSYDLVKGATVDFTTELIKASFEVTANPNAGGGCGCGSSFTPKF